MKLPDHGVKNESRRQRVRDRYVRQALAGALSRHSLLDGRSMAKATLSIAALLLCFLGAATVRADTFAGWVVRVLDGDTVEVLVDQHPRRVRLAGIDAPEKSQPFGNRAKQQLAELVGGQKATVDWRKLDRYGPTVGKVIVDGKDANLAMLNAGLAWWYRKYASEQEPADRVIYEATETKAKAERRGLWADPNSVPPWDFRHADQATSREGAHCPCGSGQTCTGPKGGHYCVTDEGTKRYPR